MADTKHGHEGPARTEGDGISYKSLGWALVILAGVTLFCYALVWGFYGVMESRSVANDPGRNPLAGAPGQPAIVDGRLVTETMAPPTSLLVNEPANLKRFRDAEERLLTTYGWVDENAGTVRLPIERAKDLAIERGLFQAREGR